MDSLQIADLVSWLQITFYVLDVEITDLETVNDVMQIAAGAFKEQSNETTAVRTTANWDEIHRPALTEPNPI